jgi:hypothetical protein
MNSPEPKETMQGNKQNLTPQQIFLFGLLGIVFVIILVVAILILTRPTSPNQEQPSGELEINISSTILPSLTPTNTITASPRFTFTPKPTRTPTITVTPTGLPSPTLLPSITPAFPYDDDSLYELVLWTPNLADQLIDLLEAYPEILSNFARGENDQGYYDAFQYALFAQQEALLRFPTAQQANDWAWQLAYNYARTGAEDAGEVYTSLITQEINQGKISLADLYVWGLKQEPQLLIESFPISTGEDQSSSHLVKVTAADNGSTYFWLVGSSSGYSSFTLSSDFNFAQPNQINHFMVDLLGTDSQVVEIFPSKVYDSLYYSVPSVYSLLQKPPGELPFALFNPPAIGADFTNHWQPVVTGDEPGDLQFRDVVFPACPVTVTHNYEWNGTEFIFLNDSYQVSPEPDLINYCDAVVRHSINVWGLEPTVYLMESLLPIWPPATTVTGKEYPPDSLDEWRYRLGIYHALLGNRDQAISYLEEIITDPAAPNSNWIEPAEIFLETYQTQRDIYKACLQAQPCNPRFAFQSLLNTFPLEELPILIDSLEDSGVTVISNGFFDFSNDGAPEQWLIIRHQTGIPLEFWIITTLEEDLHGSYVSTVEITNPRISYVEPVTEPPIVEIEPDITFKYIQFGPEEEPIIIMTEPEVVFSSDITEMKLDELQEILLTGGDPGFVQDELIILSKSSHFTCSYLLCPRFYYLHGLASELANDEQTAVSSYLDLWRQFPGHPFTIMARYKLGSTFQLTPTLTPDLTITSTSTITPTPGEAATSIPTETATPDGYPPPGYPPPETTPTATPPGFPYPTP